MIGGQRACSTANPETINADPYGDGWLFELELDADADLDDLLDADAYAEQVGADRGAGLVHGRIQDLDSAVTRPRAARIRATPRRPRDP